LEFLVTDIASNLAKDSRNGVPSPGTTDMVYMAESSFSTEERELATVYVIN
jgi:hypothetical protein